MGFPIVVVASGGLPVTEVASGFGTPVTVAANGYGFAVTIVASGGLPVVGSGGLANLQVNYVSEGDSITFGQGGQPAYPFVALTLLPGATPGTGGNTPASSPVTGVGTVFLSDTATSGISALTIDQNYATRAGFFYNAARNPNILSLMIGTNTSGPTDTTPGQKYQLARDYVRKALNQGYNRVILCSMIARNDNPTADTTIVAPLGAFYQAYYNSDMNCDYLADFGADVRFNPTTPSVAANLTYYVSDMVHPTVVGEAALGAILAPQLAAAIAGSGTKVFAPATWSPFSNNTANGGLDGLDGNVALSNGFRTAFANANGQYYIRGFPGTRSTKIYWETLPTVGTTVVTGLGVDAFSFVGPTVVGGDLNSLGYVSDGRILKNNAALMTIPTYATGDVIRHVLNPITKLYWTARGRAGVSQSWNGNASADPGPAEIGGVDVSFMTLGGLGDRFYPAATFFNTTDSVISAFAASQFAFAAPSGCSTFG